MAGKPAATKPRRDAETAPAQRAEAFQQARDARRSELVEDYVELIGDLIREGGEARRGGGPHSMERRRRSARVPPRGGTRL